MKTMFLMDYYKSPYSGAESQLLKLINLLTSKNIECELTTFRESEYLNNNEFPCPHRSLGFTKILHPKSWLRLVKFAAHCRANGFKVVHILLNDASIIAPPFLKLFGLKVIVSRLDMGFWYNKKNLALLKLTRYFVDGVVANGIAVKNKVMESEGFSEQKMSVIYNGIDLNAANKSNVVDIKSKLGIPSNSFIVGIVASLYPIKRIEDLVKAIARLKEASESNIHLVSLGGGSPENYLKLAKELEISDQIHFMGAQSNPIDWIKSFDIACLCSESEGFSNAIVEYLLCGKPVVCSDTGGNPEVVHHEQNGLLFPVGNVDLLSECILKLYQNGQLRIEMSSQAKQSIGDEFSFENFVQKHLDLYRSLA